ncbi:calcium-translocating P-type ATPase, PMCA-type [Helicobacter sp. MIT 11-5569]|uniref:calcium-translocating P-type ATPase, PMCA-type n=1 Tax=Helicobacter sp. MIT 11-5569 TaxID=1548151 RepID=UPI00051FD8F5|nr:calcium-translocating P-type ATPase, PMCA-type [Helicobacter sp. MIT 11-5569]TLD84546.1 calcium-translocating P-type ATPase, PMCA-type [Helicobacter sp. MIT 11-5569]
MKTLSHLIQTFHTHLDNGLTTKQAEDNKQQFGENIFSKTPPPTLFKELLEAFKEPMMLLLLLAAFLALGINTYEYLTHNQANFLECVGIFIAIFLSIGITLLMERRSQKAFETLNAITQGNKVRLLRDGKIVQIPQEEVVVGDIIFLESGDKIPSDCVILHDQSLLSDESSLSGESVPSLKHSLQENEEITNTTMLYRGCFITQGNAKVLCIATGDNTEFGKIAAALDSKQKSTTPLQEKLKVLSGKITLFGASAAMLAFFIQIGFFIFRGEVAFQNITQAFISSIVLIVASVPEGLPTIVAISLALNIIKMSKQNALVKKLVACETIGCVNIICSDKTGTLTQNKMTLEHCFLYNQIITPASNFTNTSLEIPLQHFLENCALNSTADLAQNQQFIGNPTECALLVYAQKLGFDYKLFRAEAEILHSFPFSSQTKNMTTIARFQDRLMCYSKGSPEKILQQCILQDNQDLQSIKEQIKSYQAQAYRVIAFAQKVIPQNTDSTTLEREELESKMQFCGFVAIADPLREDAYAAIMECKNAGISLKILTGDNLETAKAIGNQLHLLHENSIAIEAQEIEKLSQDELLEILPNITIIARSTPSIKMQIVNALKAQGNVVALTGDGINDAPALKHADVGIAMGINGTEVSKEASDIILLNDSFATIVKAVEWGRGIYQNFQRFIQFQLTVNLSSVLIVLAAVVCGFTAPFSALQLLWVNLIMDGPPALTLGLEPVSKDVLNQKPIKRNSNIITRNMLWLIIGSGIFIAVICLLQYFTNFLGAQETQKGSVLFTLFVVFQLFNAFNARELREQSIFKNFLNNRLMLGTFVLTFALQVLIVEFGGEAFKTEPLELLLWCKIICVGFSVILLGEILRFFMRFGDK